VEADGGSRGNPGNAAYGAVLKDAATGRVLAERAERIGVATNNVAEYRGLIAGLELYNEHAAGADLEVRMDSKLVVEQMAGRWKVKHPSMRPLALEANRMAPPGTRWTWVPRERNKHADRLANLALDGPEGVVHGGVPESALSAVGVPEAPRGAATLVLVCDGSAAQLTTTAEWLAAGLDGAIPVLLAADDRAPYAPAAGEELLSRSLGAQPSGAARLGQPVARLRERLVSEHAGAVAIAVADRERILSLTSSTLGLPTGCPLRAEIAPGSVTVLGLSDDDGDVVRLLGGLPGLRLSPADAVPG